MGLLRIPREMKEIMSRPGLQGATELSRAIEITASAIETVIVYIQPDGVGKDIISFDDFRAIVQRHDDPVSRRFAKSLSEWARVRAGSYRG